MMQPAEPRQGNDLCIHDGVLFGFSSSRSLFHQAEMRSVVMIVADVLAHQAFQMALVKDDDMIKQVATAGTNETFRHAILPWVLETYSLWHDAEALDCLNNLFVEVCTTIKDQVERRGIVRKGFAQLLDHPRARRVLGHIEVENAPPIVRDDEEAMQYAKSERRHCEKIHRSNRLPMVVQKHRPALYRLRVPGCLPHPAKHGTFGDAETKHLQFAMNAWRTPGCIFSDHAEDEVAQFPAHAFSSRMGRLPRDPRPIQLESYPMPANDSLWLDKDQCPLPSRPYAPQHHPEQFVGNRNPRLRMSLLPNSELLPKSYVF